MTLMKNNSNLISSSPQSVSFSSQVWLICGICKDVFDSLQKHCCPVCRRLVRVRIKVWKQTVEFVGYGFFYEDKREFVPFAAKGSEECLSQNVLLVNVLNLLKQHLDPVRLHWKPWNCFSDGISVRQREQTHLFNARETLGYNTAF